MYESFFGFKDTPFRLSADEKFRYAHDNYLRASAYLAYALQQNEGFVMITGQPGSGKTTLIRDVISELDTTKFHTLNLVTSQLHAEELLRKVALEYGLPAETYNKATLLTHIHKHLATLHEQGKCSIMFLDEAQNLTPTGLEELRLLSNLQQGNHSLLQIVLAGHNDLRRLLLGPNMEHIQQRLIANCQIGPMSVEQTQAYIGHRLTLVGWQQDPKIHEEVFHLIHRASQGIPRNINHLMSHLLLFASLEEKHELTDEDALTIIEELVDQQRIVLPGEGGFKGFVNSYREESQPLVIRQAVGDQSGFSKSTQEQPLVNHEHQNQPIPASESSGDDSPSTHDQLEEERVVELEAPDTDWFLWSNDTAEQRNSEPAASVLPNADEIWHGSMKSMEMPTISEEKRSTKQNPTVQPVGGEIFKEREHRWGGVWFMSSERNTIGTNWDKNRSIPPDTGTGLPSASHLNSVHNITVDENLSMPSVWVDDCPEITSSHYDTAKFHAGKPARVKSLKRSISHVFIWVVIGVLVMLAIRLFPDQYDHLWDEMKARFYDNEAGVQEVTPLIPEFEQATILPEKAPVEPPAADTTQPSPISSDSDLPAAGDETQSNALSSEERSLEAGLEVGDSDISSFEYIELATRYIVYFEFNKSTIPDQYQPLLSSIRNKMLLEANSFLKITGYADSQGNSNYNYRLSQQRAEAVRKFFTMRGIADERLRVTALGPVGRGDPWLQSIDTRRAIRRVEVILFPK